MFDGVAPRYDLLNHLLSLNMDRRWRRVAVRELDGAAGPVLDLCGGTGDVSVELARTDRNRQVVCGDFSLPMLERAAGKFRRLGIDDRCFPVMADAMRLPFVDGTFGGVTVAFGVRNLPDLAVGLREILRVLAPGGRLVILEFSQPTAPVLSGLYRFYLRRILPRIGDRVSGRCGPYGYLARTISAFPDAPTLADRIRSCGFSRCDWTSLTGGIVAVHTAVKG